MYRITRGNAQDEKYLMLKSCPPESNIYDPPGNRTVKIMLNEKQLSLYNSNGILYPAKMVRRISANSVELDISGLPAGFYLIRCKIANGYKTFRFVKG